MSASLRVPIALRQRRNEFEKVDREEKAFIGSLGLLLRQVGGRHYPLRREFRERLCEMSFLVLFIAWEHFLEDSFEQYLLLGSRCPSYVRPKIHVNKIKTVRELILGESRSFAGWADPDIVRKRAKLFFKDGEPYESAIGSGLVHLKKMRIIRNRAVHHSRHANDQFKSIVRELFGFGRQISPGGLLMEVPPSGLIPVGTSKSYQTTYDVFADVLSASVLKIVR